MVVDIWGGYADAEKTRPWQKDTVVNVYSTTKTMAALTAFLLADRGALDFDAPVAQYWPEFAANGKEDVKVSHVMSHSAGLSGWQEKMTEADLYDWEKATSLLAAQAPYWEPGTAAGYHTYTQGYLVGEIVRRISGCSLGTLFRTEIAEPLGADFQIGTPAKDDPRIADLIPPPPSKPAASGPRMMDAVSNPMHDVATTRTREWRAAEIPAANGHGNARSIVQIHSILANGGTANGKRFIREDIIARAARPQIEGTDLVLGIEAKYGLGFGLAPMIPLPEPNCMFWGGFGGSLVVIDTEARAVYAYAMNKMGTSTIGDARASALINEVSRAI